MAESECNETRRNIVLGVDASQHSQRAFDCKYKLFCDSRASWLLFDAWLDHATPFSRRTTRYKKT